MLSGRSFDRLLFQGTQQHKRSRLQEGEDESQKLRSQRSFDGSDSGWGFALHRGIEGGHEA